METLFSLYNLLAIVFVSFVALATGAPPTLIKPNDILLGELSNRFNYASSDCAARILATNSGAKSAGSLLSRAKDAYMRNLCGRPDKFVIVELCQDIRPDAIVVANYELFSSSLRKFRVSLSKKYPPTVKKNGGESGWRLLGEFEAEDVRKEQAFGIADPQFFARFLKIEWLSEYGAEYFCPVSEVRVYGKTMIDDFEEKNQDEKEGEERKEKLVKEETVDTSNREMLEDALKADLVKIMQSLNKGFLFRRDCLLNDLKVEDLNGVLSEQMRASFKGRLVSSVLDELNSKVIDIDQPSASFMIENNIFKSIHDRLNGLESRFTRNSDELTEKLRRILSQFALDKPVEAGGLSDFTFGAKIERLEGNIVWLKMSLVVLVLMNIVLLVGAVVLLWMKRTSEPKHPPVNDIPLVDTAALKRLPLTSLRKGTSSIGSLKRTRLALSPSTDSLNACLVDDEPYNNSASSSPDSFTSKLSQDTQGAVFLNEEQVAPQIVEAHFNASVESAEVKPVQVVEDKGEASS